MQLDGLKHLRSGKVRDIFEVGENLLIVATDRISAFDWVLPDTIPGKGKILTSLSLFWFDLLKDTVENHLITADVNNMPQPLQAHRAAIEGRSMYVRRASVIPVECIVRGYITGSGLKDYQRTGSICGISLPSVLRDSDRLPEPIFTPSTKADIGHDENVSFATAVDIIGRETAEQIRDLSLSIYSLAAKHAESRGIIIADTKFEFGKLPDGRIILIDEVLTPDSSRFWPMDKYTPGKPQPSFDKQIVRDYLNTLSWDKNSPPPSIPKNIIEKTASKYEEVMRLLVK